MIYLGFLMALLPFVLIFFYIVKEDGLNVALKVFGFTFVITSWLVMAVKIIEVYK
jgi:hypothetical protein